MPLQLLPDPRGCNISWSAKNVVFFRPRYFLHCIAPSRAKFSKLDLWASLSYLMIEKSDSVVAVVGKGEAKPPAKANSIGSLESKLPVDQACLKPTVLTSSSFRAFKACWSFSSDRIISQSCPCSNSLRRGGSRRHKLHHINYTYHKLVLIARIDRVSMPWQDATAIGLVVGGGKDVLVASKHTRFCTRMLLYGLYGFNF